MNYTINTKKFISLVEKANCISDTNNIVPAYRSVCLQFKGNDIIATASNGRTMCRCKDLVEKTDGDSVAYISKKKLLYILKTCNDESIDLSVDECIVNIKDKCSNISVVGFKEEDAVIDNNDLIFSSVGDGGSIVVDCKILTKAVTNAFSAYAPENDIHIIKGNIVLTIHDNYISICSTNGKFIFKSTIEYSADTNSPKPDTRYFIPYKISGDGLMSFLKKVSSDKLRIAFNDKAIIFIVKEAYYSCTFIHDEEKWEKSDIESVLNTFDYKYKIMISKDSLTNILNKVQVIDNTGWMDIQYKDKELIFNKTCKAGTSSVNYPVDIDIDDNFKISLDSVYMSKIISCLSGDVKFSFSEYSKPVVLESDNMTFCLMSATVASPRSKEQ